VKKLSDTKTFAVNVAKMKNWVLNPDAERCDDVLVGLTANVNRVGYYLCPCRDTAGVRERDRDITCPCDYVVDDIAEFGHCYCGLFLSEVFSSSGNELESIPERRPEELEDY